MAARAFATVHPVTTASHAHKVLIVGGGSAGLSIAHQLLRTGRFQARDIALADPSQYHHYQPGWTLVGGGLKKKEDLRQDLAGLVDERVKLYGSGVKVGGLDVGQNEVELESGERVGYEHVVVVPGIKVDTASVKGLGDALQDGRSGVSSVYGYETCDKVWRDVQAFKGGKAIFTQPAGLIKCAGAPQKVMWLAWDHWVKSGLYRAAASSAIDVSFATGLPVMFGVGKYNAVLDKLRQERGIEGLFQHDLVAVDGDRATFARPDGDKVEKRFDLLHVVPKMGPHAFVKQSALADAAGYVAVDPATLQHTTYPNVWSAGDASSLPTSKTAAAITAQAPVLVHNLLRSLDGADKTTGEPQAYDGYTSCPLTIGESKVLLAEFKYGGVPKETFNALFGLDQGVPRQAFYHLKKDFFPWVYQNYMVKGQWAGPQGWMR
ncbi:FAD/NAD(P)-binding domain-containing protein [Dothidotthia symphoricarpi CBS 119687]|uniref:FAD/NAD(P)-binding domain-containing protein n=1 Tax=Dothidotthia symphoricarpi CBS 119687 TaxID=1392245 RepID=A0A6A6AK41_9PLEO|nr:FAD/NAD(P)-binding domain-containing protein [Dothidotthia symphoricarpi CBS 119687]KAF2131247.1 FAD/NAD(P)-binding domain-containing protein [Dothidotthia symphoricarpi CBS 119687]